MSFNHHHAQTRYTCKRRLPALLVLLFLASCSSAPPSVTEGQSNLDYGAMLTAPEDPILLGERVKPVLDQRCVVCHGCVDAPCQLKLSTYEGITRGANRQRVYDGARLLGAPPTRLFIDAQTTSEWRTKGFSRRARGKCKNSGRRTGAINTLPVTAPETAEPATTDWHAA